MSQKNHRVLYLSLHFIIGMIIASLITFAAMLVGIGQEVKDFLNSIYGFKDCVSMELGYFFIVWILISLLSFSVNGLISEISHQEQRRTKSIMLYLFMLLVIAGLIIFIFSGFPAYIFVSTLIECLVVGLLSLVVRFLYRRFA